MCSFPCNSLSLLSTTHLFSIVRGVCFLGLPGAVVLSLTLRLLLFSSQIHALRAAIDSTSITIGEQAAPVVDTTFAIDRSRKKTTGPYILELPALPPP